MAGTEPDWKELARTLYERRSQAVDVPFVEKEVDGWKPRATECHRNADLYSLAIGGCRSVRGWMVFDYNTASRGLAPIVKFVAHSVLEFEDGTLIDITPSAASQRYPFLRHHGSDEEFEDWVRTWNMVHVQHSIAPA